MPSWEEFASGNSTAQTSDIDRDRIVLDANGPCSRKRHATKIHLTPEESSEMAAIPYHEVAGDPVCLRGMKAIDR
jgi:hypothetical protein